MYAVPPRRKQENTAVVIERALVAVQFFKFHGVRVSGASRLPLAGSGVLLFLEGLEKRECFCVILLVLVERQKGRDRVQVYDIS